MVAGDPAWVAEYKAILSHAPTGPAKSTGGPGGCTVCCTGFSLFGAVFLLVVAAAMKGDYPYMHIEGDMMQLSKSVTYAGLVYFAFFLVSGFFWFRAVVSRPAAQYATVQ